MRFLLRKAPLAALGEKPLVARHVHHEAHDGLAIFLKADGDGEDGHVMGEIGRAVERVNHPSILGVRGRIANAGLLA